MCWLSSLDAMLVGEFHALAARCISPNFGTHAAVHTVESDPIPNLSRRPRISNIDFPIPNRPENRRAGPPSASNFAFSPFESVSCSFLGVPTP